MVDMNTEQHEMPREEQVAKRWLKMRGVRPSEEKDGSEKKGGKNPEQLVGLAYDLFVEKQDIKDDIVSKQQEVAEPSHFSQNLSLEEKRKLIQQGRISVLLGSRSETLPHKEIINKSQSRIGEIDTQLDQIFSTSGMYDRFVADLTHQVRVRHQAREALVIDRFIEETELVSTRLAREAQVRGRTLTSVEQQIVGDNRLLAEEGESRKSELLRDPDVFDKVRILELRQYKNQLQKDRFAETPSRKMYLKKIERYWSEGKKVFLTGETGTGKTGIIKHASNKLFGVNPESVTGHQDLSIYELLGKTGFQVQVGDVFRPAPLIRAMTGREGKGQPFLFDEIDRAPNQSVMGIKTILNARPGEKGVKVQTDTAGSFDVGSDYAVSATANIKSERYATATELDPAIVRVFDAPMDIDYILAFEVYDLTLATLMDKRGGIPLTENDARVILKNLCDAGSWIQDAYQGRKVVTDPASGSFLEARGGASTGRPATLKKALLDPGRTLDMLVGWTSAQTRGTSFEDYINERILEFTNNRAYPDEDRYYLTEIFALKGFLKGTRASELMVSGLDQNTLERWTGSATRRKMEKGAAKDYLPWDRVARLDPYRRLKRPALREAEELLEDEGVEEEAFTQSGGVMYERAREILGSDFLGTEAIEAMQDKFKAIGVDVRFDTEPSWDFPYTEEDLRIAKENGEMVVFRPENMYWYTPEGAKGISVVNLRDLFQKDPQGKIDHLIYPYDWFDNEPWATDSREMKVGWAIVKKDVLNGTTSQDWNDQESVLREYGEDLKRKGAANVAIRRRTALEAIWDTMLYYTSTGERILQDRWDWIQTRTSYGRFVNVGGFDQYGLGLDSDHPSHSHPDLGVCPSR